MHDNEYNHPPPSLSLRPRYRMRADSVLLTRQHECGLLAVYLSTARRKRSHGSNMGSIRHPFLPLGLLKTSLDGIHTQTCSNLCVYIVQCHRASVRRCEQKNGTSPAGKHRSFVGLDLSGHLRLWDKVLPFRAPNVAIHVSDN